VTIQPIAGTFRQLRGNCHDPRFLSGASLRMRRSILWPTPASADVVIGTAFALVQLIIDGRRAVQPWYLWHSASTTVAGLIR
jgi:hypothetical protein